MSGVESSIAPRILGLITGTLGYYAVNRHLERQREYLSTKRQQLEFVFAPLEILMKINKKEFHRYFDSKTTLSDQEFIEKYVWYQNNSEIKRIIMEKSHLLPKMPEEFLDLLTHINVWLTEYDLIYNQKVKNPPVFAGVKGYTYPSKADEYVFSRAQELRKELNMKD